MLTLKDILVLAVVYVYVFSVIGIGELLRRWRGLEPEFTRKVIHFFAGDAIIFCPFFDTPQIIPLIPLTLALLIFFTTPKSPVKALRSMFEVMAREEDYATGHIYGPLYYIISIGIIVSVFAIPFNASYWPLFTLGAFPLFAMFYGDGLAAIVGKRWGKRKYTLRGSTRSIEGSLTVFAMSLLSAIIAFLYYSFFGFWPSMNMLTSRIITLSLLGISPLWLLALFLAATPVQVVVLLLALTGSLLASLIEGVSPSGLDNLTLPLILTPIMVFSVYLLMPWYFTFLSLPALL